MPPLTLADQSVDEDDRSKTFGNVVACLSGMPMDTKERLHELITKLGGRYTRDWNSNYNTHLIANDRQGAKYDAARQCLTTTKTKKIEIVKSLWIEDCFRHQSKLDCRNYRLVPEEAKEDAEETVPTDSGMLISSRGPMTKESRSTTTPYHNDAARVRATMSLTTHSEKDEEDEHHHHHHHHHHHRLDRLLSTTAQSSDLLWLFASCHMVVVDGTTGRYPLHPITTTNTEGKKKLYNNQQQQQHDMNSLENKLRRLLRRCMATIHWIDIFSREDDNDAMDWGTLTHVIVPDNYMDPRTREQAIRRARKHGYALVSYRWVLDSCETNSLLPPSQHYLPTCRPDTTNLSYSNEQQPRNSKRRRSQKSATTSSTTSSSNLLFQGCVFVLLRLFPRPNMVDYDSSNLELWIAQCGGTVLSESVLAAIQSDYQKNAHDIPHKRTCYVVCWGGGLAEGDDEGRSGKNRTTKNHSEESTMSFLRKHAEWHPLLHQVYKNQWCDIVPVTPVWLLTCRTEDVYIDPQSSPTFFIPNPYPHYTFPKSSTTTTTAADPKHESSSNKQKKSIQSIAKSSPSSSCTVPRNNNDDVDTIMDNNSGVDNFHNKINVINNSGGNRAPQESKCTQLVQSQGSSSVPRISVTGFCGWHRTAIIHWIEAMGGIYDDAMRTTTTHLIACSTSSSKDDSDATATASTTTGATTNTTATILPGLDGGNSKNAPNDSANDNVVDLAPQRPQQQVGTSTTTMTTSNKYKMAMEWKIPIVSLEWLHHVARHGRYPEEVLVQQQ